MNDQGRKLKFWAHAFFEHFFVCYVFEPTISILVNIKSYWFKVVHHTPTCIGKKRKLLIVIMGSGIAHGHEQMTTTTFEVMQDGGHTPANRLTETYSLGLQHSLTLDIHVMVN